MKKFLNLFALMLLSAVLTLSGYKLFFEKEKTIVQNENHSIPFYPTSFASSSTFNAIDFTEAAEKTVHTVVHVKNKTLTSGPANIMDLFYGRSRPREVVGFGSGVIISPDGYIVTNNHVIDNASQLEVKLNNNKIFEAELVGSDPKTDIALLKINSDEELPYVPFANSDEIRIGEWVLAVGNPFNLTSTVTAGIVSAKARNLNEFDGNPQSFIQTDAAVNRGNSGGALVNTRGELVGINTAISSQTGSYVGYSFAVPSNITRKVVEDILEFGNVQRAILGVQILNSSSNEARELGVDQIQGVYVAEVEKGSGAETGGIRKGDIIKKLDHVPVRKFSDLSGYLVTKRPNETIKVTVERKGKETVIPVTLVKLETYEINPLGLEVKTASKSELEAVGATHGVLVTKPLSREMAQYGLTGIVITSINDKQVKNTDDVRKIIEKRNVNSPIKISFIDQKGENNTFIFR